MIRCGSGSIAYVPGRRGRPISIVARTCPLSFEAKPGTPSTPEGNAIEHFDLTPGSVYWVAGKDLPQTHALRNTGDEEVLIITTEIL